MSSRVLRAVGSGALFIVAAVLYSLEADREFSNLAPTAGLASSVTARTSEQYEQSFTAARTSLSRFGVYLRPARPTLPAGAVQLRFWRGETLLGSQSIPSEFIDPNGFSYVRFASPLPTTPGEKLRFTLTIPPELDGVLLLQLRQPDATFNTADAVLRINGAPQSAPLAYQGYWRYAPLWGVQLAGLSGLAALMLWWPRGQGRRARHSIIAAALAVIAVLPAWIGGTAPVLLSLHMAVAAVGMLWLLQNRGLPFVPALLGSQVFAATGWFALQTGAGREWELSASLLPIVPLLLTRRRQWQRRDTVLGTAALLLLVGTFIFGDFTPPAVPAVVAHPRDILLDPLQIATSVKVSDATASWDHFGSYLGLINLVLAGLGIIRCGWRWRGMLLLGMGSLAVLLAPAVLGPLALAGVPVQHFSIGLTGALAFFAGWGLHTLRRMAGGDALASVLTIGVALTSLLDLWLVLATTLEYTFLL